MPQQPEPRRGGLRIAVVTETYPPEINGVAMTIARMVDGLRSRGHHVQLIRPRQGDGDWSASGPLFEEALVPGIAIPRYDFLKLGLPAQARLRRLWTAKRPDVAHIVTEGPLGWSGAATAAAMRIPCSSDFHTNFHTYTRHYGIGWLRQPIASYLRRLHNRTDCTMVPTDSLLEDLQREGYRNLRVVARGVDTTLFLPYRRSDALRRQWGAGPKDLVALSVGRVAPEKNLALVLRAFRALKEKRADARLVVVGDGPERARLERQAADVVFAGMRTGNDLAAHYASADLFLFPSTSETYGNVTVEAMASGLAVVAYDYAAAAQYIEHGRNGLLARFDSDDEFIQLATGLASDPERIRQFGRRARRVAEGIDWENVHDSFASALVAVAAAGGMDADPGATALAGAA
jgi:glycosyltransferase involved in cell wall biosynthesis